MAGAPDVTVDDVDDAELRAARRERLFDALACVDLDVLVLGRRDSVAYASGVRSLWTAATRPFAAACVLVTDARSTHLLSTWNEGVPPEVPFEHLYGITWNPAIMAEALAAIPGLPNGRRIGVEALSPGFGHAVCRLVPEAELVPADDLLRAVRAVKLRAEVERIRAAVVVAREALGAATAVLTDGAGPTAARAAALEAAAGQGVTVPSSGVVVEPAAANPGGSLTQVGVGLLVDGYEGGLGRTVSTVPAGDAAPLSAAVTAAQRHLVDACRPGATAADLRDAVAGATRWMVRGSGMGFEAPLITDGLGQGAVIEEGMVLSVEVEVDGRR